MNLLYAFAYAIIAMAATYIFWGLLILNFYGV